MAKSRARPAAANAAPSSSQDQPIGPAAWRDGWAWLAAASALLLPWRMASAPLGEPAGDDFLFLRAALLSGRVHWLDGGGLGAYWRPLARQAYYGALGPLMLTHPGWIAALQTALLALAAFALTRAWRRVLFGPSAAAAAAFPLIAEGHRVLVAWPGHFQDVGALVFVALALVAAARGRLAASLAASAAALLCKEVAAVGVVLMPLAPFAWRARGERRRAALGALALLAAWGALYAVAVRHGVRFARDFVAAGDAERARGLGERIGFAVTQSLADAFSAHAIAERFGGPVAVAAVAVVLVLALGSRVRLHGERAARRGTAFDFGLAWWALATLTLTQVTLPWIPSRAALGMIGLGGALAATFEALAPPLALALPLLQVAAMLLAPLPAARLTIDSPGTGGVDYVPQLARIQWLSRDVRLELAHSRPTLPPHSVVVQNAFPAMVGAMFDGSTALQVWYRDTTLRWTTFTAWRRDSASDIAALLQYQPDGSGLVVTVEPEAARALLRGFARSGEGRYDEARRELVLADALQRDRRAEVFLSTVAALRQDVDRSAH